MNVADANNDWPLVRLSDLGEVSRGRSKHRPRYAEHLYGGPYPFIQTGDIKASGGIVTGYKQTYSEAGLAQSRLLPAGTMCITIAANIAETGILTFSSCFPDSVVGFIANDKKCDVRFVEYSFRYRRGEIQKQAIGSVQDNINIAILERFRFPLPPLPTQRRIADILGALDDQIECNRRINQKLEAMAQTLYKHWFVDFGPFRDGEFVDSELGEIPKGWRTGSVLELADLLSGGTPSTNEPGYWNGGIAWASAKDVSQCGENFLLTTERTITERGLNESATRIIPAFSTVVVARGATTGRFTMFGEEMAMNQTCYALRSREQQHFFLRCWFERLIEKITQAAHGSVFDTITTTTFQASRALIPPTDVRQNFDERASHYFEQILVNQKESAALARTRDYLLPRLLSGEIEVRAAEEII